MKRIVAVLLLACCAVSAKTQAIAAGTPIAPADAFNTPLNAAETQVMLLVKAMPADKYGFAPSAAIFAPGRETDFVGVRTFGALVIHVAQANYGMAAKLGGIKPDIDPASLRGLTDKDQIVAALSASFAFVHKAFGTITTENVFLSLGGPTTRATLAAGNLAHTFDEYGQMVEYARMTNVKPPPSGPPAPPKAN